MARGELVEAVAAVEIAAETGDVQSPVVPRVQDLANELYAVLTKLVR